VGEIVTNLYHMPKSKILAALLLFLVGWQFLSAQSSGTITTYQQLNVIQSTVPFITFAPDSRSWGLGYTGVASSPDVNSQYWNPAKYAFIDKKAGISMSYFPWMPNLFGNMHFLHTAGYYRINNLQTISASARYFSLGTVYFGTKLFKPYEVAIDGAYSRALTGHLSLSIALRYIHSDLTGGYLVGSTKSTIGKSIAGDLALYHFKELSILQRDSKLAFGLNISNIGNKIAYTVNQDKSFIPTNLRTGGSILMNAGDNHSISMMIDLNKLLVPSSPIYDTDTSGTQYILYGKEPYVSVLKGMIQSFYDAPGYIRENGERSILLEELHEIILNIGLEYRYRDFIAVRGGYFHEHVTKGDRKFFSAGLGIRYMNLTFDMAYLIPTRSNSKLKYSYAFTVSWSFQGPEIK